MDRHLNSQRPSVQRPSMTTLSQYSCGRSTVFCDKFVVEFCTAKGTHVDDVDIVQYYDKDPCKTATNVSDKVDNVNWVLLRYHGRRGVMADRSLLDHDQPPQG